MQIRHIFPHLTRARPPRPTHKPLGARHPHPAALPHQQWPKGPMTAPPNTLVSSARRRSGGPCCFSQRWASRSPAPHSTADVAACIATGRRRRFLHGVCVGGGAR